MNLAKEEGDALDLKYFVNQIRNNYNHPNTYDTTTHEIELNITFDDSNNWIIEAIYYLNILRESTSATDFYQVEFTYEFHDDTKKIYKTYDNDFNVDYTNAHSYISSITDLTYGSKIPVRVDDLILIIGPSANYEANITYQGDDSIDYAGNTYDVKLFKGHRDRITCTA